MLSNASFSVDVKIVLKCSEKMLAFCVGSVTCVLSCVRCWLKCWFGLSSECTVGQNLLCLGPCLMMSAFCSAICVLTC